MPQDSQAQIVGQMPPIINISQNGWTAEWALVERINTDSSIDVVVKVVDWDGGVSLKPPVNVYIGTSGFVSDIKQAKVLSSGSWTATFSIVNRTNQNGTVDKVLKIPNWLGTYGQKPESNVYLGTSGLVSSISDAVKIQGDNGRGVEKWNSQVAFISGYAAGTLVQNNDSFYESTIDNNKSTPGASNTWVIKGNDLSTYAGAFKGSVIPADSPSTPSDPIFYTTTTSGIYTNFLDNNGDPIEVTDVDDDGNPILITFLNYVPTGINVGYFKKSQVILSDFLKVGSIQGLDDYVKDSVSISLFNKGYFPTATIFGNAQSIPNTPYSSSGTAIKIPSGQTASSSYVTAIDFSDITYTLWNRKVRFYVSVEHNSAINVNWIVSRLRVTQSDGSFTDYNSFNRLVISNTVTSFSFDYEFSNTEASVSLLWQISGDSSLGFDTTYKTTYSGYSILSEYSFPNTDTVNYLIDEKISQSVNPISKIIPQKDVYAIFFGDSQTEGVNNNTENKPYADNAGHLLPQYRWPNIFVKLNGKNLLLRNEGVGSSKISWSISQAFQRKSHFNVTGILVPGWTGLICAMNTWNNLDNATTTDSFFFNLGLSHIAFISRCLIDGYAGVTFLGWSNNAGEVLNSWSTTGTNDNTVLVPVGELERFMPFRLTNVADDGTVPRYRTKLVSGQYIQFTLTNKRAVSLNFETDPTGGDFVVKVNGNSVGTFSNQYSPIGGNDSGTYPRTVFIENLPASAVIRIEQSSGNNYFLAYGWVNKVDSNIDDKNILYGSTSGNNAVGRKEEIIIKDFNQAKNAVGCFKNYPVYFVDVAKNWNPITDQEVTDISHLTDIGNQHVAEAFQNNASKPVDGYSDYVIIL